MVNPKRSVLIKEMEHLLKIWLDRQVQRRVLLVSQAFISAKVKSLKEKKAAVQRMLDQFFTKQPTGY
jgi:hypothetical protein